jgi:outer membrane protein TolC
MVIILFVSTVIGVANPLYLDSVNDAIKHALDNNPNLEIYKQNQDKAEFDYDGVKNYWLPSISASFSGVNNTNLPVTQVPGEIFGRPGTIVEAEFGTQFNYNTGISISQSIFDFQSKFTAKVAEVNMEIAAANEDAYKQKLVEQVALYYYTAIITSKAVQVHEEDYVAANEIYMLIEQKFAQGIVDQHTVNLSKINRNNIRQNLNSFKIILEQCDAHLQTLFGSDAGSDIVFNEKLHADLRKIPAIENIGPDKSLELYKLQLKQASYQISQEKAKWYPKLSINGYWGAQLYQDNFDISLNTSIWAPVSYLSLNISVPIFNGFSTKSKVDAALVQYDISREALDLEITESQIADASLLKEFSYSKDAVEAAGDNYHISKENAALQLQKFEQGLVSLDKYLESFDDYLKAELTYLNLLSETYNYYAKILSRNL